MGRTFSEDSRVKIPALLHFTRLGYRYRSLKDIMPCRDYETNINKSALRDALNRINIELLEEPLSDEELNNYLRQFYSSFYRCDLTDSQIGRILAGM